jgi:hypothetical protein
MKIWMMLLPFATFAAAFCFGAVALWYLAKRTKITQTETQFGKAVHVESPVAVLDVHPEGKLDSRLAQIPIYPGAMREEPLAAESVTELHVQGAVLQEISAQYWTPQEQREVWDFYRQQLPDWPQNLDGVQGGKELISRRQDYVLLVRVSRSGERTRIETCIKPPKYPHVFERGYR